MRNQKLGTFLKSVLDKTSDDKSCYLTLFLFSLLRLFDRIIDVTIFDGVEGLNLLDKLGEN